MSSVINISFSPTGSSLKAAEQISEAFDYEKRTIDLCKEITDEVNIGRENVCIFSMPCYGGRIPETAVQRLLHIHGSNTSAVVCVTFGNRAYEDALLELADCVEANGFKVIAGCAVATEHNIMHVFGTGRPDDMDREQIKKFAAAAAKKAAACDLDNRPEIPGQRPYKEKHSKVMPILVGEECNNCGLCEHECPVHAISTDGKKTDEKLCINCMRCIDICPNKCRKLPDDIVTSLVSRLKNVCSGRKNNEFFI